MRSRLRGAGAGQSAVKGTRGGGAAAGPRGAFPYHGPCQVQPTSGLPLGAGGVCIWGRSSEKGKLWATPSQRRHGGPPGQGWEGWAALAAATHLQGPPAEAEVPGPEGDPGPTSHLRGHSQEWGLPWHDWCSRAGAHHRRASQPHRSRGTVGSALRGLPATWACILHPLAQAPRGTTTAPDSQALPRSPPHSARKEEMQQDLRVGHGGVREHPRGARRRAWGLRPPGS